MYVLSKLEWLRSSTPFIENRNNSRRKKETYANNNNVEHETKKNEKTRPIYELENERKYTHTMILWKTFQSRLKYNGVSSCKNINTKDENRSRAVVSWLQQQQKNCKSNTQNIAIAKRNIEVSSSKWINKLRYHRCHLNARRMMYRCI